MDLSNRELSTENCENPHSTLDILGNFISNERTELLAEIHKLRAENAALLLENAALMQKSSTSSTIETDQEDQILSLTNKVTLYQRLVTNEREESTKRERVLSTHFQTLQEALINNTRYSHSLTPSLPEQSVTIIIQRLVMNLAQRAAEMKEIRELVESKAVSNAKYISSLEHQLGIHSILLRQNHDHIAQEVNALKHRLRKVESLALEFVPLSRQEILNCLGSLKEDLAKVHRSQKHRNKRESICR
ncbi:hypothetical protein EDC01DRAFT_648655 [Geopyxis carbonaria]|nr:hypothetical protein EDC01DRAFT_648655 [Geopyxis carbonaria]